MTSVIRKGRCLATIVVMVVVQFALPASLVEAQSVVDDPTELFRAGNAAYEAGDYAAAIDAYQSLAEAGVDNAVLYYNLGNAYYKNNSLGHAVLYYLRSLRVQPRNDDAKENLELVRSQLRDKQFVRSQNRLVRAVVWLHDNLTTREMLVFASISYVILCLLAIVFVFRDTPAIGRIYGKISILSLGRLFGLRLSQDLLAAMGVVCVLLITSGVSSYIKLVNIRTEAVVLVEEVAVYSSPTEDATLQFKIHEGTMVGVGARRDEWTKIELPGGMSGWVVSSSIEGV